MTINHTYLLQHISYHLHTLVRRYSPAGELLEYFCARINFFDELMTQNADSLMSILPQNFQTPILLSVNAGIVYAFVPAASHYLVIGPVLFSVPVYLRHQITADKLEENWLKTVPCCEFNDFVADVLLAYNLYHQDILDSNALLLSNCIRPNTDIELQKHFSNLMFENRENEKKHNPYDQEMREFSSIEHGDLEQLKRSLQEDYPGEVGTLAKDPVRQAKNRAIVVLTLACRAAIRGGIPAEIAYPLSDVYIQKAEEIDDIPTLFHLFHSAEFQYAQMVKDLGEQKTGLTDRYGNPHIHKCKDYIFTHLHDKITVQDIACELNLNANYLSWLFHKCEKISLTDFIQKEKIKLAQNLLIYSRYSYIEIATYLGYSSQSHLGKQFKKHTGMTLRRYREAYGVKEFM